MPGSKREREAARRRYERRQALLAQRRQRARKRNALIGGAAVIAAAAGGIAWWQLSGGSQDSLATATPSTSATPSASPSTVPIACGGTKPAAPKTQTFASEPPMTIDTSKSYTMTLDTSCGAITVDLLADKAPHTVNSLNFLAGKNYYDGSFCHRETSSPSLTVLQCGDPTGTGSGNLGYTLPEENLKGATYTRGTVAMAKTSAPHSTGSQFFLVDKDSQLPAEYTVVGHISKGLDVLDKIFKLGIAGGSSDAAPAQRVYLQHVTVTAS